MATDDAGRTCPAMPFKWSLAAATQEQAVRAAAAKGLNMAVSNRLRGASAVAICAVLSAHAAMAQDAPASDRGREGEIVVTAQKRSESIRDVPFSIAAIGNEELLKSRVQSIEDIVRRVPSLEVGVGFGRQSSSLTIRGVSPQTYNSATVVTFTDGFTTGLRSDVTADLFDLERVEILKGPQATLYGRNAIGGTINYITRKPSNELEGRFQAVYGSYETYAVRGSISGPIVEDVLAIRMSASATGRDGYFDNVLTGESNVDGQSDRSIRVQLRLTPGTVFESNLLFNFTETSDACGDCVQSIVGYSASDPTALGRRVLDVNQLNRTINHEIYGGFERPSYTAVWTNSLDLGGVTVSAITGYNWLKTYLSIDLNRAPGPLFFSPGFGITEAQSFIRTEVFSQELRLASDGDNRFDWMLGAYYYYQKNSNRSNLITTFPGVELSGGNVRSEINNYALFFNGTYELSDRLELGFGLRYDYERTNQLDVAANLPGRASSSELLPRLSLTYRATDDINIYGTISRGYHSGGVNASSPTFGDPPVTAYGPEFVWNYEIGLKGGSPATISYDLAAFWIDWTDQQVTSTNGLLNYIVNAGTTRIYGIEGSIAAQLTDNLQVTAAGAWTHARYRDFLDLSGIPVFFGVDPQRAGERPLLAPDFSGTLGVEYRQPIGAGDWDITGRGNVRYTGTRSIDTSAVSVAGPFAVADISLSAGRQGFRVTGFVNNLFDKTYANYQQLFSGLVPLIRAGAPRVAGVQVDMSF